MELFKVNNAITYTSNPYASENQYTEMKPENSPLPAYEANQDTLPEPYWDGHKDVLDCYNYAWKTAFGNLRKSNAEAGFVSNFIDTAFNGHLYMWDSSFIVMFGKYGSHVFDFQKTLDNFYARQHWDGFICREISEDKNGEIFSRFDPSGTGPNIMPWSEWESYLQTGDKERLSKIFPPLLAYHLWLKENHTWRDGTYWSTGWGCGMDNQPRQPAGCDCRFSTGHMVWVDTCAQQILSARLLCRIAIELGRDQESAIHELETEAAALTKYINEKMWSETDGFYYDRFRDGSLSGVKTIGAYWTLLAGIVPPERLARFIDHLNNPKEFNRPNRVPTLSADDLHYCELGDYWKGSVWAPTNYMVLKGLEKHGQEQLIYDIACSCLKNTVDVYQETGTLWENYAPEKASRGSDSREKFVGWSGLFPISILIEYVFGIRPIAAENKIVWYVNRTERHGIRRYPFGGVSMDLCSAARNERNQRPEITVNSPVPVTVEIHWGENHTETIFVTATK